MKEDEEEPLTTIGLENGIDIEICLFMKEIYKEV